MRNTARYWRYALASALALLPFLCGCGSGVHQVEGQVLWRDGSPAKELAGSHVIFDLPAKKTGARGVVQPDGSFKLTTNKPDDGALAGEYNVLIVEVGRKSLGGPDPTAIAPGVMDSRFSDPLTSDLKVTIRPGVNKVTLTVDRAGPAQ